MSGLAAASSSSSPMCQVLWIHARGTDISKILSDASFPPDDSKAERVFTQRPATRNALSEHVSQNGMLRSPCAFAGWLGHPLDVFYYPPPPPAGAGASDVVLSPSPPSQLSPNAVVRTLLLAYDGESGEFTDAHVIPHGLCLCVASGVVPASADGSSSTTGVVSDLRDVTKDQVLKLITFMGQVCDLGPSKILVAKEQYESFDHLKVDRVDSATGSVVRAGLPLHRLQTDAGLRFPDSALTTTDSGLSFVVLRKGTGTRKPTPKTVVTCHYCGWLGGFESPRGKFDSSRDKEKEFKFMLGVGEVIQAWDEAVADMVKGERRLIIVPEHIGYGKRGAGDGIIPPGATLYFDVELIRF